MFMQRCFVAGLVAGLCCLAGCQEQRQPAPQPPSPSALAKARSQTAEPAWLDTHMPAHSVAYLRLPSIWELVGTVPNGRPLDKAVGEQQLRIVQQLRKAAAEDSRGSGSAVDALIETFMTRLASPLEAALVDPVGMPTPNARVLVVAKLRDGDAAHVQQLLDSLPEAALHLAGPLDAQGDGALAMGARVHFDAASRRLFVLVARQPLSRSQMQSVLGSLARDNVPPSMARTEPGIDRSGQGLFAWFKLKGLAALASTRLPPELSASVVGNLFEQTDAVALGAGTVDGHGRLRVTLAADQARLLGYLAPKLDFGGLRSSGDPRWAFTFALPTAASLQRFQQQMNLELGARGARVYRALMAKLASAGVPSPLQMLKLLGPELITFGDASGTYTAVRLRDAKGFHAMLARLAAQNHWQVGVADSGKARVHWLSAPSFMHASLRKDLAGAKDANQAAILRLYANQRVHLFWIEQGDWLVFADVPQALADRAAAGAHASVADWLRHQDFPPSTWIGATAVSHDAKREAYYRYLRMLVALGDMLGHPVDIMPLPSASRLGLPGKGVIGGGIAITPGSASLQLDYQQMPTELVHGHGGMSTVAVVAILAAIAIPQYQDYITRAQFSESQVIADGLKMPVTGYALRYGRCPANGKGGIAAASSYAGKYVQQAVTGGRAPRCTITVQFKGTGKVSAPLAGKQVVFAATIGGRAAPARWSCSAPGIADKYLPLACRH